MGTGSGNSQPAVSAVGHSRDRPLCHCGQQKGAALLQPPSSSTGREAGDRGLLYLYPPLSLAHQSLHKIRREEAEAIVVLPYWPRRGWLPLLLEMLVDHPVRLPQFPGLVVDPLGETHPDLQTLSLTAWRVSGVHSRQLAFQQTLQPRSRPLCDPLPGAFTPPEKVEDILWLVS